MKATVLDLRRRMRDVLRALDRNEPVTLFYRGREKAVIQPSRRGRRGRPSVTEHPAFGLWKTRRDLRRVEDVIRRLREGRPHAV